MTTSYNDYRLLAPDRESFRRQESSFAVLNLLLIAALLLVYTLSTSYFGNFSPSIVAALAVGFMLQAGELMWLHTRTLALSEAEMRLHTWWLITLNTALTIVLPLLTREEDSHYFVLMAVPVLVAAFRLGLVSTVGVVALADFLNFFEAHLTGQADEYFEAGATSLIYAVVGVLVWLLVNNLREREVRLARSLHELERTRERLLAEEKLAAVGRLSSAIAHEIRNPVAMISSSLAMAVRPGQDEAQRREMFAIAAKEATRLEQLTTDFLAYARPRAAQIARSNVADTLNYVAAVARAHAANKGVAIAVAANGDLEGDFDPSLIQQALLNLVLNAVDACKPGDAVTLRAETNGDGATKIDVIDPAGPVPHETTAQLFEPFFTTKPHGTGLGLATARNIARAHSGDLVLSVNEPARVCFSLELPRRSQNSSARAETHDGQNTGRR